MDGPQDSEVSVGQIVRGATRASRRSDEIPERPTIGSSCSRDSASVFTIDFSPRHAQCIGGMVWRCPANLRTT